MQPPSPKQASVAVPVYRDSAGKVHVVLIQRSLGGVHGGEVALPGGKREPEDENDAMTALREACEELCLNAENLHLIAPLTPVHTRTTGYRIAPFLFKVRDVPDVWRVDEREVATVLDVLVDDLAHPDNGGFQEMHFDTWDTPKRVPVLTVGAHLIWGVTLRILKPLLSPLQAHEWDF